MSAQPKMSFYHLPQTPAEALTRHGFPCQVPALQKELSQPFPSRAGHQSDAQSSPANHKDLLFAARPAVLTSIGGSCAAILAASPANIKSAAFASISVVLACGGIFFVVAALVLPMHGRANKWLFHISCATSYASIVCFVAATQPGVCAALVAILGAGTAVVVAQGRNLLC